MMPSALTRRVGAAAASLCLAGVLAACSTGSSAPPDIVGTWSGTYTYPEVGGGRQESGLTIVITKQDGALLYGYEEWQDGGNTLKADLVGSLTDGAPSFVLVEAGGFFSGAVNGDTMTVRFIRTVEGSNTSFETRLTRQQ